MAKGQNQKLKLLYLAQIFSEKTDESHGLTMPQLIAELERFNVNADRKTLYLDMEELRRFGMDVLAEKEGKQTFYKLVSRNFELAELKLLVDAVQSSRFITESKSRELIGKLESLVSVYDAKQLQRQVVIAGRVKTMNESIYYNIDILHNAISENRQIQFCYFHWNVDKQEEYGHNGDAYVVSPWLLHWDDENYYLIAYDNDEQKLKHYRVDKMRSIALLDTPREGQSLISTLDATDYSKSLFGMFSGESCRVTLMGENEIVGVLIDRFGKDVPVIKTDDEHFTTTVDVTMSPQFLGWVASLGGKLRITAPDCAVCAMRELAEVLAAQY